MHDISVTKLKTQTVTPNIMPLEGYLSKIFDKLKNKQYEDYLIYLIILLYILDIEKIYLVFH